MPHALFAFENRDAARQAASRIVSDGLPSDAVQLHIAHTGPNDKAVVEADELLTGGLVRNVLDLFQGVLEWGSSPHDASAYEETVRRGGAVLEIEAPSAEGRALADRTMAEAGFDKRTDWSDLPQAG